MVVGIRGTSGYVYYDDAGRESLVITDGTVHVTATNPIPQNSESQRFQAAVR